MHLPQLQTPLTILCGFTIVWLTHWGRAMHICGSKLTIIGSDNGLSPGRRQAIIWTIAGILLIEPLGTNFSENLIGIQTFSFKKMHLKISSAKWRPFCLGLNVLKLSLLWVPQEELTDNNIFLTFTLWTLLIWRSTPAKISAHIMSTLVLWPATFLSST